MEATVYCLNLKAVPKNPQPTWSCTSSCTQLRRPLFINKGLGYHLWVSSMNKKSHKRVFFDNQAHDEWNTKGVLKYQIKKRGLQSCGCPNDECKISKTHSWHSVAWALKHGLWWLSFTLFILLLIRIKVKGKRQSPPETQVTTIKVLRLSSSDCHEWVLEKHSLILLQLIPKKYTFISSTI